MSSRTSTSVRNASPSLPALAGIRYVCNDQRPSQYSSSGPCARKRCRDAPTRPRPSHDPATQRPGPDQSPGSYAGRGQPQMKPLIHELAVPRQPPEDSDGDDLVWVVGRRAVATRPRLIDLVARTAARQGQRDRTVKVFLPKTVREPSQVSKSPGLARTPLREVSGLRPFQ